MSYFIFQGNPDRFDIDTRLTEAANLNRFVRWTVSQHIDDIHIGDTVFLWRSAGRLTKAISGVVAVARVLTEPKLMPDDEGSLKHWKDNKRSSDEIRVELEILKTNLGVQEVVRRDWMKEDPVLDSIRILTMAQGTNFLLTKAQGNRLLSLADNTGILWTKAESMAALWLYEMLYGKSISKSADSPTAETALLIGRAVTGVYNKLMNFRSIDPRDERKGLSGINRIDQKVWDNYFDVTKNALNTKLLNADFDKKWGVPDTKKSPASLESIEPTEAADDDVNLRRLSNVRIRKGQSAFRRRLLFLYEGKCAISGVSVGQALDAAHVFNHSESGLNGSENGIMLRSDLHQLFDAGLLTISPNDFTVCIDDSLLGGYYGAYHGQVIRPRIDGTHPSKSLLEIKNRIGD